MLEVNITLSTRCREPRTENEIEASFSVCLHRKSSHEWSWMLETYFGRSLVVSATDVESRTENASLSILESEFS